jgi:hypothetical protein
MVIDKRPSKEQFEVQNPLFLPNQSGGGVSTYTGTRRSARRKAYKGKEKTTKGSGKKSMRKGAMEEEEDGPI